ncbi:hypothetical protein BGY98DRAFT_940761 [Russula aff. rugulosa BPL654]|nr:hypothetical protein BGY98DRAFT_940761 [Russula aff. rugulosa BPL654]
MGRPSPRRYPCQTASLRPPQKSSASIVDNGGTTVSNATPPTHVVPKAAVVSPPVLTRISIASAQPGTGPAGAAEALRPLTEDYIDNGGEQLSPDEPPRNSLLFRPDTPIMTRSPTYWNGVELQTAPATVPTPPSDPDWPLVLPWECLDDPSVPPEWGGRGGLVNGGLEVSVYNGGNMRTAEDVDITHPCPSSTLLVLLTQTLWCHVVPKAKRGSSTMVKALSFTKSTLCNLTVSDWCASHSQSLRKPITSKKHLNASLSNILIYRHLKLSPRQVAH